MAEFDPNVLQICNDHVCSAGYGDRRDCSADVRRTALMSPKFSSQDPATMSADGMVVFAHRNLEYAAGSAGTGCVG